MRVLYSGLRYVLKTLFITFHHHKTYGIDHYFKGGAIIAPNHNSFYDPPLIGISWPEEISFLARKSLFGVFLGPIITKLNAYPVAGTQQDLSSIKLICSLLQKNKKVVIFPEGLRSKDGDLQRIKPGIGMIAMRSNCPIIPVYIHGSYRIWNRHHRFPRLWGQTACVFGSPIHLDTLRHLEKKEAQDALADSIKKAIDSLKIWYENGAVGSPP